MSQYQPKWSDHFQSSYETNMLIDLAEKYGLKTTDSKELRKIMESINTMEEYLRKNA